MRAGVVAACAAAALVTAGQDSVWEADLDAALSAGDECVGGEESCALNELQLRAGRTSKEEVVESSTWSIWPWTWFRHGGASGSGPGSSGHGLQHPTYCDQARWKDTTLCTGNATCKCQTYCETSDKNWWGTDPNCCACDGAASQAAPQPSGARPAYCHYLPATTKLPWCEAAVGCRCQAYCKQSVAPTSWGWDPNCCACSAAALVEEARAEGGSAALAHPIYCRSAQAAQSKWCQGENTCSCQQYCTLAVPPANWGWDPNCCLCNGSSAVSAEPPPPIGESPSPAPAPDEEGTTHGGLTHPIYCLTSPLGVYSPYCLGANTCHCVPYCKLSVLPAMWGYDPSCCACSTLVPASPAPVSVGRMPGPVSVGRSSGPLAHPLYCEGLKTAGIHSPWCAGRKTCSCRSYCALTALPSSWGWDPQCCACSDNATLAEPAEPTEAAPAASKNTAIEPLKYPSYCESVPPDTALPWCSGEASCKCELYCKASVMPSNWGMDPNCCACASASGDDGARPGESPPAADDENGTASVAYGPLTRPRYCESLPENASNLTWCEGNGSCACEDYCTLSVAPSNWGWDPNCCACATEEIEEEVRPLQKVAPAVHMSSVSAKTGVADGVSPSLVATARCRRREFPAYCAYIEKANKPEACLEGTGGCACDGVCKEYVPAQTWKFHPQCCGCE